MENIYTNIVDVMIVYPCMHNMVYRHYSFLSETFFGKIMPLKPRQNYAPETETK